MKKSPPTFFVLFSSFLILTFVAKQSLACNAPTYQCGNTCCSADENCDLAGDGSGVGNCSPNSAPKCAAGQISCSNKTTKSEVCCPSPAVGCVQGDPNCQQFVACVDNGCAYLAIPQGSAGDPGVQQAPPSEGSSGGTIVSPSQPISPYCGNGKINPAYGEECDLGADNGKLYSTCSSTCKKKAAIMLKPQVQPINPYVTPK